MSLERIPAAELSEPVQLLLAEASTAAPHRGARADQQAIDPEALVELLSSALRRIFDRELQVSRAEIREVALEELAARRDRLLSALHRGLRE